MNKFFKIDTKTDRSNLSEDDLAGNLDIEDQSPTTNVKFFPPPKFLINSQKENEIFYQTKVTLDSLSEKDKNRLNELTADIEL